MLCAEMAGESQASLADLGNSYLQVIHDHPGRLGKLCHHFDEIFRMPNRGCKEFRVRDALPLRPPVLPHWREWQAKRKDRTWRRRKRRDWIRLCQSFAEEAWL